MLLKKIHGSNISIEFTKEHIKYFTRKEEITLNNKHFWNRLLDCSNLEKIISIGKFLLNNSNHSKIIIYGELYGNKIQKMNYQENLNETNQFRVFDVFGFKEDGNVYSFGLLMLLQTFDENLLVPIKKDFKTLKEWIDTPLTSESELGGEKEGLVYKPLYSQILRFDKNNHLYGFIGVKHKREDFQEVKKPKLIKTYTDEESEFIENITRYITPQRLDNVMSKESFELSNENIGKIIPLFLEDVKKDYLEDYEYFQEKLFNKTVSRESLKLIKKVLSKS